MHKYLPGNLDLAAVALDFRTAWIGKSEAATESGLDAALEAVLEAALVLQCWQVTHGNFKCLPLKQPPGVSWYPLGNAHQQ